MANAERLRADGVDVVLDQWDLKDGQDVNDFMEQMVKDPEITRVIVVVDAAYADKANLRTGGVGTETQIISKQVYESVEQTKFVPILKERDAEGKACLPTYLASRKYVDFSDEDYEASAYDQLLRNIFDRPKRTKPPLGEPPSHIFSEESIHLNSAQKSKRFRECVANGRGSASAAFDDFAESFMSDLKGLRIAYSRDQDETWCEQLFDNIQTAIAHRDAYVDVVSIGAAHLPSDQFTHRLLSFLENLLPFRERPEQIDGTFFEVSEDNYKFLCYEFFLYTFACYIKAQKYDEARRLVDHRYVSATTCGGDVLECNSFEGFNTYPRFLEETCSKRRQRTSTVAELVRYRATRRDFRFTDLMQSDLLLCLASGGNWWYPRTMVYAGSQSRFELFLRAATSDGFMPIGKLLNLSAPRDLIDLLRSEQLAKIFNSRAFWHSGFTFECMNLTQLEEHWNNQ